MYLGHAMGVDKTALMCDMAETYHIYEMERLPVDMAAAFVSGLHDDSRIKKKISGVQIGLTDQILLHILDSVRYFKWSFTEDAHNGGTPPESIYDRMMKPKEIAENKWSFETDDEFREKWNEINGV